ncbi:DNA-binding transcriptional regulator, AcrR family [Microlunatus sagamiharensis]|uniref:DNA-binding transcriptional regulator, AcrR family n=1 Tax=Microlunatus sagamiharensis TaxID=546874 RepID=A0A1H2LG98_9ACTN|nr:TetR/AcrR family transcriptional regulator [Microlunatus sagamiharensis]SDU79872.1 DNA-binding transcriptional regulator, AcrR family [Microlunatus sagamiharensis]
MSVVTEGRTLTAKGAATRARIVAVAARLVYENGVAGTSLEQVRDAAGISNSQLYHYFDDKQALVRAVIRHNTEAVLGADDASVTRLDSFVALEAWRDAVVANQRRQHGVGGCPLGSLVGELADVDDSARRELDESFRRWSDAIAVGLTSMRERGLLRADADPARLALAVLASLQGGLVLTQTRHSPEPLEVALDGAIALIRSHAT